jgi:hypothetical protein
MDFRPIGHVYQVIPKEDGKYMAVMILSEHDNQHDAFRAMYEAMKRESKEILDREVEELRKRGIKAVTLEEAVKDMTPEELKRFLEERRRKFVEPLLDMNIKMLKQKLKQIENKPAE